MTKKTLVVAVAAVIGFGLAGSVIIDVVVMTLLDLFAPVMP